MLSALVRGCWHADKGYALCDLAEDQTNRNGLFQRRNSNSIKHSAYVSPALSYDFPFAFTEVPVVQMTPNPSSGGSVFLITGSPTTKTNTGAYYLTSFGSRQSFEYNIHVYAVGKWK